LTAHVETLPWDSEFFGMRIGRVQFGQDSVDPQIAAEMQSYDCVYVEMDVALIRSLPSWLELGARPIDVRIELRVDLRRFVASAPHERVEAVGSWGTDDRVAASALVKLLSAESRFRLDPRFAPRVEDLYGRWLQRAFSGADNGLVWREHGEVVGLLTYRIEGSDAWLELLAVSSNMRGGGIGTALTNAFLLQAQGGNSRTARVRTHLRNLAAVRVYESAGFRMERCLLVLHRWTEGARTTT